MKDPSTHWFYKIEVIDGEPWMTNTCESSRFDEENPKKLCAKDMDWYQSKDALWTITLLEPEIAEMAMEVFREV